MGHVKRTALIALLVGAVGAANPVLAHTPDSTNQNFAPGTITLTASGQLSSPTNNGTYTGAVTFSSASAHNINVSNGASGQQTITYSYDMELILDDVTTEATNAATNAQVTLLPGANHTVSANLSHSVTAAAGARTADAFADVSKDSVHAATDHHHSYTQN